MMKHRSPNDEKVIRRQAVNFKILEDRRTDPATVGPAVLDADVPYRRSKMNVFG